MKFEITVVYVYLYSSSIFLYQTKIVMVYYTVFSAW